MTATATQTWADVLKYREDLVRTGKYFPLGLMQKIAIGPAESYTPPPMDPQIAQFGRLIDLRNRVLPIAQSPDKSMLLVTAPLPVAESGAILPDVPRPGAYAEPWTREESEGRAERPAEKDRVPMIRQRLEDRTQDRLKGTNFLVFCPLLSITFQPSRDFQLQARVWIINFRPDPMGIHASLLVDMKTGAVHVLGGLYDIATARGE